MINTIKIKLTMIKNDFFGFKLIICLHNSDPILPPAPEIKTFLSLIFFFKSLDFGATGTLPRIS